MFRKEVTAAQGQRLLGDVSLAVPLGWHWVGWLLFAIVTLALVFLATARYSRVQTVSGEITADIGVAAIVPGRAGVLSALAAREGEEVPAGFALATVQAQGDGPGDASAGARMAAAIDRRRASLDERLAAMNIEADARRAQFATQRRGLMDESERLAEQVAMQERLVATAEADLARLRALGTSGFISPRDLQQREDVVSSRRQSLAQLSQSLLAKRAALRELDQLEVRTAADARAERASLAAMQAESDEQAAEVSGLRGQVLRAPVAGRVTALTARVGQAVTADRALMLVVPAGARPVAELRVPPSAIGFIRSGQRVRLAIDAFPYQNFGTVGGTISTVARAPVVAATVDGARGAYYPVTVRLDRDSVDAYGRKEPLVFGMTLSARVVVDRRSLLEWLFEPLLAVRGRQDV